MGALDRPSTILGLDRVRWTPHLVAAMVGVLGLASLGHQLLVSATRRRPDVVVLWALGTSGRRLRAVVHWQAIVFAVVVVAVATVTGVTAGRAVFRLFVDRVGAANDVGVPSLLLGGVLVALLAFANAVAAIPARQARRRSPARVLALQGPGR